jgi:DNA-binding transcriptional regulator YhcF (GntR family)
MMPARPCVFVIMLTSTTSESQPVDDAASDVLLPLYQRLAAHYSAAIELGSLKPGERMPSVRELMARHDISLSTALQVLRFLEAQGCLEARPAWATSCARRGRVIFL